MPKYMSKDFISDPAVRKRKDDNYRAKKRSKSIEAQPGRRENIDGDLAAQTSKALTISENPVATSATSSGAQDSVTKPRDVSSNTCIPFKTQLRILTTVQGWLEEACFDFTQKWLPNVLAAKDIDLPEKAELTEWTNIISKELKALPKTATQWVQGTSLRQELTATHQLRNAAIRRQQLSSARLLELLDAAINVVIIMKDKKKVALIEDLIGVLQGSIGLLGSQLHALGEKLSRFSAYVEAQRNKLADLETNALEENKLGREQLCTAAGLTIDYFLDGGDFATANIKSRERSSANRAFATPEGQQDYPRLPTPPPNAYGSAPVTEQDSNTTDHLEHFGNENKNPIQGNSMKGPITLPKDILIPSETSYNTDNVWDDFTKRTKVTAPASEDSRHNVRGPTLPRQTSQRNALSLSAEPSSPSEAEDKASRGDIWGQARHIDLTGQKPLPSFDASYGVQGAVKMEVPSKEKPIFSFQSPEGPLAASPTPSIAKHEQSQVPKSSFSFRSFPMPKSTKDLNASTPALEHQYDTSMSKLASSNEVQKHSAESPFASLTTAATSSPTLADLLAQNKKYALTQSPNSTSS